MTEAFYLILNINMRINVPIKASSLENAIQKAKKKIMNFQT